jgi:hypothetical protein
MDYQGWCPPIVAIQAPWGDPWIIGSAIVPAMRAASSWVLVTLLLASSSAQETFTGYGTTYTCEHWTQHQS